ncbi:MAG: hypothetical protein IJX14_08270, partial [Clostridia bacterium]|nr:hypothetical protein [Clostridia bacterium]
MTKRSGRIPALLTACLLCFSSCGDTLPPSAIITAAYPEMAAYPDERKYRAENGEWDPAYDALLQEWINEQTGGLLEDAAGQLHMSPETILALATTVYYQAKWDREFQKENNTERTIQKKSVLPATEERSFSVLPLHLQLHVRKHRFDHPVTSAGGILPAVHMAGIGRQKIPYIRALGRVAEIDHHQLDLHPFRQDAFDVYGAAIPRAAVSSGFGKSRQIGSQLHEHAVFLGGADDAGDGLGGGESGGVFLPGTQQFPGAHVDPSDSGIVLLHHGKDAFPNGKPVPRMGDPGNRQAVYRGERDHAAADV